MKKKILNALMSSIKKNKPDLNDEQLEIIEYGLEGLYLTTIKIIIIILLSIILNIFKETILMILFYNIPRFTTFGMHAKDSKSCLITSLLLFIGGTYLAIYANITLPIKIVLSVICLILIIIYAPADTHKRPIINTKHRKKLKCTSIIITITYIFLTILINDNYICNLIYLALLIQSTAIIPITYKIFKMPYNNYKAYQKGL